MSIEFKQPQKIEAENLEEAKDQTGILPEEAQEIAPEVAVEETSAILEEKSAVAEAGADKEEQEAMCSSWLVNHPLFHEFDTKVALEKEESANLKKTNEEAKNLTEAWNKKMINQEKIDIKDFLKEYPITYQVLDAASAIDDYANALETAAEKGLSWKQLSEQNIISDELRHRVRDYIKENSYIEKKIFVE